MTTLIDSREAARICGVKISTWYYWRSTNKHGIGQLRKFGGKFNRDEVLQIRDKAWHAQD
jgi:hypothetical protein